MDVIDSNVIDHIAKYATVCEFIAHDYKFQWSVVSNDSCDDIYYKIRMSIVGAESNVTILTARITSDRVILHVSILGEDDIFRDGVVSDEGKEWFDNSGVFDYATGGLNFTRIGPVIVAEIERFMHEVGLKTGSLESESTVMMFPLASIVGSVGCPMINGAVVWYPKYNPDRMNFVIATRGVFGLTSWLDVLIYVIITHDGTEVFRTHGINLYNLNNSFPATVLETVEVCDITADILHTCIHASAVPEMYREDVVSQILRVCCGMFKDTSYHDDDTVTMHMRGILGESYLSNVSPGIGVWG